MALLEVFNEISGAWTAGLARASPTASPSQNRAQHTTFCWVRPI